MIQLKIYLDKGNAESQCLFKAKLTTKLFRKPKQGNKSFKQRTTKYTEINYINSYK